MRERTYIDFDEYKAVYKDAQFIFCDHLNKQLGINVKPSDFDDHWYKMDNVISYGFTFEKEEEDE